MQEHQKRVDLTGGGTLITIFTEDGRNREGLENFSVSYYPGAPHLYLQHGVGNKLPFMVNGLEEIRLLHETSDEVLQNPSRTLPEQEESGGLLVSYTVERLSLLIQHKAGNRLSFTVDGPGEIRLLFEACGEVLKRLAATTPP